MRTEGRSLYRSRNGMILGVCAGIAEYLDFSVFWMRVITVVMTFFLFPWLIIGYFVAGLLMKPEPVLPFESEADQEFYNSYVSSRPMALHRLKRTYDSLERRIRRIEDIVTKRDYDWEARLGE
jgi:phage shock protein C